MTRVLHGSLVLLSLLVGSGGCAGAGARAAGGASPVVSPTPSADADARIQDPPRRPGKPLVLVAMPDSASFRAVRSALVNELEQTFDIATQLVDSRTTPADFSAQIHRAQPSCVVLMDNPTIKLYRAYQSGKQPGAPMPAAVVVMSSFLEELRSQLRNVTGVAYEVPGVTAFVNLRSVIARPVSRVGVIHRPPFRKFIERQKALATKEQIELVAAEVPKDPDASEVRDALRRLSTSGRVDTLWVLNDNGLLRDAAFLESAWRGEMASMRVPVIVGVPGLVSGEARFGGFAVVPDLAGLGVQAANVVFELSETGWRAQHLPIELPVSTLTLVNLERIQQTWGLRAGAMRRIDKVVE
jgi:hypothetical protein